MRDFEDNAAVLENLIYFFIWPNMDSFIKKNYSGKRPKQYQLPM